MSDNICKIKYNRALKWCLGLLLKKLLLPALLFCRCLFTLTSWLRVSASGSSDKMKRGDRGGAEGCFLKGSCDQRDHSESRRRPRSQCQQTRGSKRRECVPMWHPPPPWVLRSIVVQCGLLGRKTLKENSFKDALLPVLRWSLISLLSGAGTHPICDAECPGCHLVAWRSDCLIGCPPKATTSYCALTWQQDRRQNQSDEVEISTFNGGLLLNFLFLQIKYWDIWMTSSYMFTCDLFLLQDKN